MTRLTASISNPSEDCASLLWQHLQACAPRSEVTYRM